jgi:hypothetical protein
MADAEAGLTVGPVFYIASAESTLPGIIAPPTVFEEKAGWSQNQPLTINRK